MMKQSVKKYDRMEFLSQSKDFAVNTGFKLSPYLAQSRPYEPEIFLSRL